MKKHSVNISGHATSVTLEDEFWILLQQIAKEQHKSINKLIAEIDAARGAQNLSSAIRVYILNSLTD